ncbi:cell division protein FtsL [Vibrio sp. S4M6]|uniref:cell division protein FtsL n=1 Tax=Vibrio sinus TaxID=2946865 RepID=UPI00202A464E|nr:cell division protein FtsL [Vibrio sinus]MCL9781478.1 cell division protein FtsL [Vibrio sinus]
MDQSSPNLAKLIAKDLVTVGRLPLILMLLVLGSALGVVYTTHNTRIAVAQKDKTLVTREKLDDEWRNLLIEETSLADSSRVETIAKNDLNMERPDSSKEVTFSAQ